MVMSDNLVTALARSSDRACATTSRSQCQARERSVVEAAERQLPIREIIFLAGNVMDAFARTKLMFPLNVRSGTGQVEIIIQTEDELRLIDRRCPPWAFRLKMGSVSLNARRQIRVEDSAAAHNSPSPIIV